MIVQYHPAIEFGTECEFVMCRHAELMGMVADRSSATPAKPIDALQPISTVGDP